MITYKVGICDDEADEVKKIEDLLHEYEATHNIHFEIHSYTDGLKLLRDYQNPHMLHALFLDVEMPLFNGIDLAEHLRGLPDRGSAYHLCQCLSSIHEGQFFRTGFPVHIQTF